MCPSTGDINNLFKHSLNDFDAEMDLKCYIEKYVDKKPLLNIKPFIK
jgi:hypothetical protein